MATAIDIDITFHIKLTAANVHELLALGEAPGLRVLPALDRENPENHEDDPSEIGETTTWWAIGPNRSDIDTPWWGVIDEQTGAS